MMKTMKVGVVGLITYLFMFIIYGCASIEGPQLAITPGFIPKKTYSYNYDQMLDKVLSVLKKEKIMLATINKESGIIQTDYIQGPTVDVAAISTNTYRYKYQITFEKISPSQTQIEITCKLEEKEMMKGGSAREAVEQLKAYEDVTYKYKERIPFMNTNVAGFELWLYEQIEKSL